MGQVLWHVTMSLDGFIAGPGDVMDWAFRYAAPNPAVDEIIRTTGAVLVGRRSYAVGAKKGRRPEARRVFGGAWTGPQFVLTHRAPNDAEDPTITFLSEDVRDAVPRALEAADGKNVVVIGANVAQQCIDEGLATRSSSIWRLSCAVMASGSSGARAHRRSTWSRPASRGRGR